ncbi:hypothetical protein RhiirA5_431893 [Rhizophagus irregularis]|uniref:Uncharacterized protein n=1 Tax=Rhizophagus irregularis TaxID=588596 RepID=A0A2N0NU77_9GLOM|nr:hypothetical protein RhiirA5_431893 [Rhizophagus irregularis]
MKINGQLILNEFHDKDQPLSKGKSDRIDKALMRFFICCEELGYVNSKVLRELEATKNLTLTLNRWSSLNHLSIWNFTILTPTNKEYIYQLLDLSSNSHTGEFIAEKIEDILIRVGAKKFSAIVSDNGAKLRELIKSINVKGDGIVPFCKIRWT